MHTSNRRFAFIAALVMTLAALSPAAATAAQSNAGENMSASGAWRCGPDGRIYTDTPCAGGREIELPLPRPAADVAAAHRLAAREKLQAEHLKRERERREAAAMAASTYPANLGPVRTTVREPLNVRAKPEKMGTASKPRLRKAASPRNVQGADEQTWRATAPSSPRAPG